MPTSDAATRISDVLTRRQRLSFFPSSAGFFFPAAAYIFFRTHIRARREGGFRFVLNHGFFFPYSIDLLLTRQTTGAYIFSPMDEHTGYIPAVQQTSIPATQADVNSCNSRRVFPSFPTSRFLFSAQDNCRESTSITITEALCRHGGHGPKGESYSFASETLNKIAETIC